MTVLLGVGIWVAVSILLGFAWALLCEVKLKRTRRRR